MSSNILILAQIGAWFYGLVYIMNTLNEENNETTLRVQNFD